MNVFSRTWALMGASWRVLMLDKELLLFPFLSLIATALVTLTFVWPLAQDQSWLRSDGSAPEIDQMLAYARLFLFYVCTYFTVVFFNAALIAAVHQRLTGRNPTLMDGMRGAWARKSELFAWVLLAATVGVILQAMKERSGWLMRLVIGAVGVAWSLATYFVVPILVIEGKGPIEAVQESAATLKRTWGEELIGGVSYSGLSFLFSLPAILVAVLGAGSIMNGALLNGVLMIGTAFAYAFLLSLTITTLSSIFHAAVYHYARTGSVPEGFDATLLQSAFVRK
jgi:uncharacterized protein DUF6159/uncharacterized protein DUF4013